MVKTLLYLPLVCCLGLFGHSLAAQNDISVAGLEAQSGSGSLSASIGLIAYTDQSGSGGSLSQGLQQAYEIFLTTSVDDLAFELDVQVFPNPTKDRLTLRLESPEWTAFQYQLIDAQGRVLEAHHLPAPQTEINFRDKSAGSYFIQLIHNGQIISTYKILKTR